MTSQISAAGLTVDNYTTVRNAFVTGFQGIYGSGINVDQNSPDGQRIGIMTQQVIDLLDLLVSINNNFDPDQAVGTLLDQRVAINNIQRAGGTYSVQPIDITVNQTVTLAGLDGNYNSASGTGYTVQDSSGNQFILAATTTLTAGTTTLNFRAGSLGAVNVPVNTITTPVTIVLGVTAVNNSLAAITVGQSQETDAQLRTRRSRSTAIAASGYLNGLLAKVLNLSGVTEAVLYENTTNSTDGNGTTAHTMWLVVAGGSSADIGNTIYQNKSYGASMRGSQTYAITKPDGSIFTAQWDAAAAQTLYIAFTIKTTVSGFSFNQTAIKAYIAANITYQIGAYAETSVLTAAAAAGIAAQGGGGVAVLMTVSTDGITYTDYVTPSDPAHQFTISTAHIAITVV